MQLYSECMYCIVEHHWSLVKDCPDEARKAAFMRDVLRTVAEADESESSPVPTAKLQKLYAAQFAERNDYPRLKRKYNELVMGWTPELRQALASTADPFKLAVWMAMAGNYIDFGILKEVDDARLKRMLATPDEKAVGTPVLEELRADVRSARHLVYACDNCGEVVLDRLLMEEMKKENPGLQITALVRGENVLNDVRAEDARAVGLDRVAEIARSAKHVDIVERFKGDARLFVAGSTWGPDEELLIRLINDNPEVKFIIAPHEMDESRIARLIEETKGGALRYTQCTPRTGYGSRQVLILDTVGLLASVYGYATWSYIGGGFGVGIHNTLEAATFGLPVAFGPNYHKFKEARDLVTLGAARSISNYEELQHWFIPLRDNEEFLQKTSRIAKDYTTRHQGATNIIVKTIFH